MHRVRPDLVIRPVDPYDQDEMLEYQRLYAEAERAEFPDAAVYSAEDTFVLFTRPSASWFYRGFAAFEDGRMVGEGLLMGELSEDPRTARLWAWVPPYERGRGVGGAVVDFLVEESRSLGRGILHSTAVYPFARRDDHPYRRFAEGKGFTIANTEVERRLSLPVDQRVLVDAAAEAAPHHVGYRLETFVGPIPTELAAGYCDVLNRLRSDAPSGDLILEESRRTPADIATQDEEIRGSGRTRVTTLAFDRQGAVVALSCAVVTGAGQSHIDQWGTVVRSEDRGHRLGLAVKAALIATLQRRFPAKAFITTTNAETNEHMVAINERLGFRPYALSVDFQRLLPLPSLSG